MSCIFLSHSSADELEAVALKQWLRDNGWDDVFLDIDPDRGLAAGDRWQEALRRAADRCEAVVLVVSPAWAKSKWCLTEFLLAKSLSKLIFGVVLKEIPIGDLPTEMTAEWQLCHLVGQGATETIRFTHREKPVEVNFLADGLRRLRSGLQRGGLSAGFFPWPPKDDTSRAPYRGLEPMDARDAAMFFGRDAEILHGLDTLRGMRASGEGGLFVIPGASGGGKSSFLRAGLLPRLARDDRHFFPLEIVRPERSPLFGERGLAHAICKANSHLQLAPVNPGDVMAGLKESPERFAALLRNIQNAARARLFGLPDNAPPPTLVLPVDQAEALFNADATEEARAFLAAIGAVLRGSPTGAEGERGQRVPLIVVFTIRSDRYEPLRTASELAGLKPVVFDALRPMPIAQFKDVIFGPANRARASGSRLELRPDLVAHLLADCAQGGDTLPLLSLALARLYREYGSDGDLQLDEYTRMGGIADVIKNEAESILATDPDTRKTQLALLHGAFIPWLATINAGNEPMRRVAHIEELPKDSRPLVQALIERRLLVSDIRDGEEVVEVAHESLLRQWKVLADWLGNEREDLKESDRLEQEAKDWKENGKKEWWLRKGERLGIGEALAAKSAYRRRLEPVSEFLLASRQNETKQQAEKERQRQAELVAAKDKQAAAEVLAAEQLRATERAQADAARLKKLSLLIGLLLLVAVYFAISAFYASRSADEARDSAKSAQQNAEHEREVAQKAQVEAIWHRQTARSERMLDGRIPGGNLQATLQSVAALGFLGFKSENDSQSAVLASLAFSPHTRKIIDLSSMRPTPALAFSPDGMWIAVGGEDGSVLLLDAKTGKAVGPRLTGLPGTVWSLSFSGNGARLVIGMADPDNTESNGRKSHADGALRVWDLAEPKQVTLLKGHRGSVYSVAYSKNSDLAASAGSDGTLRVWDAVRGSEVWHKPCVDKRNCDGQTVAVAISPDGAVVASGGDDAIVRLWDAQSGKLLRQLKGHSATVQFVEFSPKGSHIGSASDDSTARVWDIKTGKQIKVAEHHKGSVYSLSFSRDDTMLATASADGKVRLFLFNDDKKLELMTDGELKGHLDHVYAVAFSKDGESLISTGKDGTLRRWGPKNPGFSVARLQHSRAVTSVAVSPDGRLIASGSDDGTLQMWETPSLDEPSEVTEMRKSIPNAHRDEIHTLSFSADGTQLLSGGADNTVRFWDAETGESLGPALRGHTAPVRAVVWGANDQVISAAEDGVIRVWNATFRETVNVIPPPKDLPTDDKYKIWSMAVDPQGRYVAAGGSDGQLRLWNTHNGSNVASPPDWQNDAIFAVAVSRDGALIATGGADGSVFFWKATPSKDGLKVKLHSRSREPSAGPINSVAFSADGEFVVSSGKDKLVRLWNPEDGTLVGMPLAGHTELVESVAFSSRGDFIVSAGHDQQLLLWPGPKLWGKALCSRLTQNMSQKQWRDWVSPDIEYHEQCPGLPILPDEPEQQPTTVSAGERSK